MTKKKRSKHRRKQARIVIARLVLASSTMLARVRSMAQSLWSQPGSQSAPEIPKVHGCRRCGLIYEPRVYLFGSDVGDTSSYCPKCAAPKIEFLGSLPLTTTTERGVYFIGELDEAPLGPFKNDVEAHSKLWAWFDRRQAHADRETKEGPATQGKVIHFIPKARPAQGR